MAALDNEKIKKLVKGERWGKVATVFCAVVLAYFAVTFSVGAATGNGTLQTVSWATAAPLMIIGIALAAFFNLNYGAKADREIINYVLNVFIENAALMHPERNSLSFFTEVKDGFAYVSVNGYKERITFDFSAFGKLNLSRKVTILDAITNRIIFTFCRLYDRGASYKSVDLKQTGGRKNKKPVPVIVDGVPDKRAYKQYLKNK